MRIASRLMKSKVESASSQFHEQFGYYAEGIHIDTVMLPDGWRNRLVRPDLPGAETSRAAFLEPHDLVVSTLSAGRKKGLAFAQALVRAELVDLDVLVERVLTMPDGVHQSVIDRMLGWAGSVRSRGA